MLWTFDTEDNRLSKDSTIPSWRIQLLNIGTAGMAAIALLTFLITLFYEELWQTTSNILSATAAVTALCLVAIWRSGPYYLRVGAFIAINILSIVMFLAWIGFTASPALAGLVPILLAGLLLGTRWAVAVWLTCIAVMFSTVVAINQGVIATTFNPRLLNPADLSFGIRYTLGFATFSVLLAVGATAVVDRLNRSLIAFRKAQEQKEDSEAQWTSLVENAPDLILIVDREHTIEFRNRPLLGFGYDEVVGLKIERFLSHSNSDEVWQAIEDVFTTGETRQLEVTVERADKTQAILATRFSPITSNAGVRKVTTISTDISEQKELELQLQQAQKVEAIGQLAAGVAHDFNNLLMIMRGHAELIGLKAQTHEDITEDTQAIVDSADRGGRLTRQLLAYSRMTPQQIEPVDLRTVTENIIDVLRRLVGGRYEIAFEFSDGNAVVDCDQSAFEQVLTNLIINARDAMPEGGQISIRQQNLFLSAEEALKHGLKPGNFVSIAVIDEGVGIDEANRNRIFEPFFTTKPVGSGTGLGLSMAYGSVRNWQGAFKVTGEVGVGSSMEILLPRSSSANESGIGEHELGLVQPAQKLTVLLVEDDRGVREVLMESLAINNFDVISAGDGAEALVIFSTGEHQIDVVLSDISMPQMTGTELARELQALQPNLPILLMSGYPLTADAVPPGIKVISKPIAVDALVDQLRGLHAPQLEQVNKG